MKHYSLTQLAQAYLKLRQQTSAPHALKALAAVLIHEHRTHQVDLVIREIRQKQLRQGEAFVAVETAHEVPTSLKRTLEGTLCKLTGARQVTAQYTLQPELIGGFRALTATHEINASLQNILEKL